jgi:hypothetical protein
MALGKKTGGRRKGSIAKKTREIAEKAIAEGITPLEVMLKAMRLKVDENDWDGAAAIAKDAAPYMHAKLASVEQTGPGGGPMITETIYRWASPVMLPPPT